MKRFILAIIFCLVSGFAYADASFEIVAQDIDNNGNIRVWTQHKIDGVEVVSQYPKINGKSVWATRYSKQNFAECKDKAEIEAKIMIDIANYSNALIQKEFDKNAPKTLNQIRVDYNTSANQAFVTANLDKLVGKTSTVATTSQKIDINNDGVIDTELTLKTDGTKTIQDVVVIVK